jgi:hypothetical protein
LVLWLVECVELGESVGWFSSLLRREGEG